MFDRWQVCLGYYWYAHYGYRTYEDACRVMYRLDSIGYKPSVSEEYSEAMDDPNNTLAFEVFQRLSEV